MFFAACCYNWTRLLTKIIIPISSIGGCSKEALASLETNEFNADEIIICSSYIYATYDKSCLALGRSFVIASELNT
jgi:hypothetical protein